MCRLLAYAAKGPTTFPEVIGDSFSQFVELSSLHCDGWGLADSSGLRDIDIAAARQSEKFQATVASTQSDAALLHLRWASPGIPVDPSNNHPFTFEGLSFIHNGSLHPYDGLDSLLEGKYKAQIVSASDSHRYFMLLAQTIDQLGLEAGILAAIETIRGHVTYASLNAMLLSDQYLVMINEHDPSNKPANLEDEYYDIRYKFDGDSFVIGSSGWDQEGWTLLANHTILILKRDDLTMRIVEIPA